MGIKTYTPEELHPVSRDGRRLEGQEFDGHDVLEWIKAINRGGITLAETPAWIRRCIPDDAIAAAV